jgi:glyoxylase-like metal-dependent hydrolase (beta-lactamase superfamily II)
MPTTARIQAFFDEATHTVTYLVHDPATGAAAVIDPVLDYDHRSGQVGTHSARRVLDAAAQAGLRIEWVLETHAHTDHLSAAPFIKQQTGARVAIGAHITAVQRIFRPVFNLDDDAADSSGFDRLLADGDTLALGDLAVQVLHTPGHTPACVSYRIGDADFPGGDARTLYRSIRRLLALPPHTRLFMCHDYKAPGRDDYAWVTTVAEERARNIHVRDGIAEADFVTMREQRDATLAAPTLLLPSIQVNIHAGQLPRAESNGVRYLKIPLRMGQ